MLIELYSLVIIRGTVPYIIDNRRSGVVLRLRLDNINKEEKSCRSTGLAYLGKQSSGKRKIQVRTVSIIRFGRPFFSYSIIESPSYILLHGYYTMQTVQC